MSDFYLESKTASKSKRGKPSGEEPMSCDCHSYNGDFGSIPSVMLPRPWFMEDTDRRPNGVPVDACIADLVAMLWENKIVTLSSCCGHGRDDLPAPSIVLGNGENAERASLLVVAHDAREVTLFQWQLVDVSENVSRSGDPEPTKLSPLMPEKKERR